MLPPRRVVVLSVGIAVIALVLSGTASGLPAAPLSPAVSVTAEDTSIIVNDRRAQATFRIRVTNAEAAPIRNVFVAYADGNGVFVGDIAANASALSQSETRTFEVEIPHSKHHTLPVTVQFSLGGEPKELPAALLLEVQE